MLIRGDRLEPFQRRLVLAAFPYRWTRENPHRRRFYACPHCDLDNFRFDSLECRRHHPTVSLQSDDEWLAERAFHFVANGHRLDRRHRHAAMAYEATPRGQT